MRRILARAKRRSRAFSKVSPSVSLSPFVVELVCAFYFAKEGSSSSESPASRYTTPVMPTFSLSVEGECSKHKRERGERILASGAFSVSRKSKNSSGVAGDCFCASFAFFELVSFSLCLLFYTKACGCLKKMHLLIRRVSTFCVNKKTPTKRCQTLKKYSSQKSPHNLASHHHHHRERYQTHARRRLFSFSERESVEVRR